MLRIESLEEYGGCLWHHDKKIWEIRSTPENEAKLAAILPTFAEELRIIRSQMSLL